MYKDIKTNDPNILVHITYARQSNGKTILRGYAVDAETMARLNGAKPVKRTAACDALVVATEILLTNAVMDKMDKPTKPGRKHTPSKGRYTTAIAKILDAVRSAPEVTINPGRWGKTTQDRGIQHYLHNCLPYIETTMQHQGTVDTDDIGEYRAQLARKAQADGRSNGNPSSAATTASNALYQDLVVHQWLVDNHPELDLPVIEYSNFIRTKKIQIEQAKSIPDEIRNKYIALLERSISQEPCKVYCAVLMLDAALRTAEACAVSPDEIIYEDKYSKVIVIWQMKKGERIPYLKTESAYRQVVLSHWGTTMLLRCIDAMIDAGTEMDADHPAIVNSEELSAWVKQQLRACGLTEDYLAAARRLQALEPDPDSEGKPIDVCAYILRRDRASRWRSICGLSADAIDYMLGHVRHATVQPDYRLYDDQCVIAEQLERDVYNPAITLNPAYSPIVIDGPTTLSRLPQQGYIIACAGTAALQLRITGTADEVGSIIKIQAPIGSWNLYTYHNHTNRKARRTKHKNNDNSSNP